MGGVWNYTPFPSESLPIPQMSPDIPLDQPFLFKASSAPIFSNPMYERLNTNIPKGLMQYSDQDFLSESLLFPTREDVQNYIIRYSKDVRYLIKFCTQVEDLALVRKDDDDHWKITSRSTRGGLSVSSEYDAVVVASGHYSLPFIPSIPGIQGFAATYPGLISHSKTYRSPESFKGKKVLVVGGGPSGSDIGSQVMAVCKKPLLNSVQTSALIKLGGGDKVEVPPIAEYLPDERSVRFGDGRIEMDIDAIIYCTGYLYSYPFLKSLEPPLVTTGRRVIGLYKQLFHIGHPTLAFTALSQKVIPFPLSEAQAAVISKVWSNKLLLPSVQEMEAWEKQTVEERGDNTNFHVLAYPQDANYINELHDWAGTAEDGFAKEPPYWDEKQRKTRSIFVEIKKRFVENGSKARSMEELGL